MKNVWQRYKYIRFINYLYGCTLLYKYNKNDELFFKTTSWWHLGKHRRGMEDDFVSKNCVQYNINYTIILTLKHLEILTD